MAKLKSIAIKRVLFVSEYQALIGVLPSHTTPIVATGYWTGMRFGEIANFTWEKVVRLPALNMAGLRYGGFVFHDLRHT